MADGSVGAVFLAVSSAMDAEQQKRERIQSAVQKIALVARTADFALQGVQSAAGDAKALESKCAEARGALAQLGALWREVAAALGGEHEEKFRHLWEYTMGQLVFVAVFVHYLERRELMDITACKFAIGLGETGGRIGLDVEEFLGGVCSLPRELARLCVNCVTAGDYRTPHDIAKFVNELYAGFRLLNLRNDTLRRRYDGIKYSLQKIEEVIYDVQVRRLAPAPASSPSPAPAPAAAK